MNGLSNQNFGLVIAYVLPGFVALWGVSYFSPTVAGWIAASQEGAPTVAGFMYVTLASLGAGLTVSGVRWALVDSIHHLTGLKRPAWKFVNLDDKLQGFLLLNESHYRYYQFYANMFIAAGFTYASWLVWERERTEGRRLGQPALRRCGNDLARQFAETHSRNTTRE